MLDLESLFKLSYGMCIVSSKKADKFNACIVNTVPGYTRAADSSRQYQQRKSDMGIYQRQQGLCRIDFIRGDSNKLYRDLRFQVRQRYR